MPGSIQPPTVFDTLPFSISTKFSKKHTLDINANEYHDGSCQRTALMAFGRRQWSISKRLSIASLDILRTFWFNHRVEPFYFYDPHETNPPFSHVPTGSEGRYIVRFNSDWEETIGMVRSEASIDLIEIASGDEIIQAQFPPPPPPITTATVQSLTLSVITSFSQVGYNAFASINQQDQNNFFASASMMFEDGSWGTRTDTFSFNPATTNPASLQLYFGIEGSLGGTGDSIFRIYDASLAVGYSSGSVITFKPTAVSSYDTGSGAVTNAAQAIDGDPSTFAQVERTTFSGLGSTPILFIGGWQQQ